MSVQDQSPYIPRRIRINISAKAFHILKSDESCFASIVQKYSETKISDKIINKLINNMDISSIDSPKGRKFKYDTSKLVNVRFDTKLNKSTDSKLDSFKVNNKGAFVSNLLEIYASNSYHIRERIYFSDCIEKIKKAKSEGNLITIRYRDNNRLIYPYDIRTDEWSSYNYLVGTEIVGKAPDCQQNLINLRISYISCPEVVVKKPTHPECRFTECEIEDRISSCGIQFISGKLEEIKVRLPQGKGNGKDMYDHMVFMRPAIYKMPTFEEPDIYTFRCTTAQARFYFFKFGSKVEVISPMELRKKFMNEYEASYLLYKEP